MKHLTVTLPHGVALQPWAIPGQPSLENRLLFNKENAIVVRDWLCRLANEATQLAMQVIDEEMELLQLQQNQKRQQSVPADKSQLAMMKAERQRLEDQAAFVPMNPDVAIPDSLMPQANEQPAPRKPNVVKDVGQEIGGLRIRPTT
jgi:hypothetical protein